MFCKNCGKELADEAIMCPDCGTPTSQSHTKRPVTAEVDVENRSPLSVIALVLSILALVCCIAFVWVTLTSDSIDMRFYGSLSTSSYSSGIDISGGQYSYDLPIMLLNLAMAVMTVLTALGGLISGLAALYHSMKSKSNGEKAFAITSIILAGLAILLLFIMYTIHGNFY